MNQSESINDISMYFSIFFNVSQLISTYFCDLIISDQRIYGNLHVHPRAGQLPGPAKKDCHSCWRVCRRSWRSARRPPIQSLWRFLWMGGTPKSSQSLDHISTETDWNPWFWGSPISGNPHIYRPDALKLYKPFCSTITPFFIVSNSARFPWWKWDEVIPAPYSSSLCSQSLTWQGPTWAAHSSAFSWTGGTGTASISAVSGGSVQAAKASAHQAAHLLPSILKIGVTLKEEEQRT